MESESILNENNLMIKSTIAKIVGIPESNNWEVFDSKPEAGLYLIHYTKNSNMYTYGHIRGIIVDINKKMVVCNAYKYTPVVKADKIEPDETGKITFYDELGRVHTCHENKMKIVPGFEVVTIRSFLHQGKVYYPTYKKIDVWNSDSHWGDPNIPFDKMCHDLNIPSADVLFPDKSKQYSNFAYIFMLVHPGILNVSKINLRGGFILYGGAKVIWNLNDIKSESTGIDPESIDPKSNTESKNRLGVNLVNQIDPKLIETNPVKLNLTNLLQQAIDTTGIYEPEGFNIKQAEAFLKHGYYPNRASQQDVKQNNGEFVIIYTNNTDDPYNNVLRIESSSFRHRSIMKDNKPNLKNQLWKLFDYRMVNLYNDDEYKDFMSKFVIFNRYSIDSIIKRLQDSHMDFWPGKTIMLPKNSSRDDIMYIIWINFILIVPLHRQKEVALLYNEYFKNKKEIVEYLYDIYIQDGIDKLNLEEVPDNRIFKLLELGKNHAINNLNKNHLGLVDNKDAQVVIKNDIKYNLDYLVTNELGKSFYKIYKKYHASKSVHSESESEPKETEQGTNKETNKETNK